MNEPISSLRALFDCYLEEFAEPAKQVNWAFRGQGDCSEKLKTSLERVCEDLEPDHKPITELEEKLLVDFQRHYLSHVPQSPPGPDEIFDWMALMQHHGVPTRLLDFTYSFFIAVYFALKKCKKDEICTVWAVDFSWLRSTVEKFWPNEVKKLDQARHRGKFQDVFSSLRL